MKRNISNKDEKHFKKCTEMYIKEQKDFGKGNEAFRIRNNNI